MELEQALIDNLQQFLLELGKGFSFVARQKHIRTESSDFFIDLVFYNFILKCFLNESKQLFANKYLPFLPTEEELIAELEREKLIVQQRLENEK